MSIVNTQSIKVPIDGAPPFQYIVAKQGDVQSRRVEVTLTERDLEYTIQSGTTARVKYYKPDGNKVINDCTISSNKIIVTYTEQMLAAAGTGYAEVALYNGSTALVSATFYTKIVESVYEAEGLVSDSEYLSLNKILVETTQARDGANNATAAAETATRAANTAAATANSAAATANSAAGLANTATGNANKAITAANEAAVTAAEAAKSVYTDRNYDLLVNDNGSVTLMYDEA